MVPSRFANVNGVELARIGTVMVLVVSPAAKLTVPLTGVKSLVLKVGDAGDGNSWDHADWADAKFEMVTGRPVFDKLREEGKQHPIEEVGRRMREMMSWIRESKKDSSER